MGLFHCFRIISWRGLQVVLYFLECDMFWTFVVGLCSLSGYHMVSECLVPDGCVHLKYESRISCPFPKYVNEIGACVPMIT